MIIETERLLLRPWAENDAASLFRYASDPEIGPAAGWPAHVSVEESRHIIRTVFSAPETYAICLREQGASVGGPVGSIGLMAPRACCTDAAGGDLEVGYWIGKPHWGRGLVPEALRAIIAHAFDNLGCERLWCCHYEGNERSRRCMEKCGFRYVSIARDVPRELLGDTANELCYLLERPGLRRVERRTR